MAWARARVTTVSELTVGGAYFTDVVVSVNQADMNSSLLGMTFLKRFKCFQLQPRQAHSEMVSVV